MGSCSRFYLCQIKDDKPDQMPTWCAFELLRIVLSLEVGTDYYNSQLWLAQGLWTISEFVKSVICNA